MERTRKTNTYSMVLSSKEKESEFSYYSLIVSTVLDYYTIII